MVFFTLRIEQALNVSVQCSHDADPRKHCRPPDVATRISASIAACHSLASCSAFGSRVMQLPASSRVTNWRPRGNGIGSSKGVIHPISFGVASFHFLLTRSRQHRDVTFTLGRGHERKTKAVTTPRWRLFLASLVNLGTACADRWIPGDCTVRI